MIGVEDHLAFVLNVLEMEERGEPTTAMRLVYSDWIEEFLGQGKRANLIRERALAKCSKCDGAGSVLSDVTEEVEREARCEISITDMRRWIKVKRLRKVTCPHCKGTGRGDAGRSVPWMLGLE